LNGNKSNRGPLVRIGVIQSIDSVELSVNTSAQIISENGQKQFSVGSNQQLIFSALRCQPAQLKYVIRLARVFDESAAGEMVAQLKKQGIPAESIQVGEVIEFAAQTVDNREYWIVTGNLANLKQAQHEATRPELSATEEQTILAIPLTSPTGQIGFNNQPFGAVVRIIPENSHDARISVSNVRVGIEFHWDHRETQDYRGIIEVRFNNEGQLQVINELPLEDYLTSVNSSEMTPDCPMDLLKAQTVAARSTILATMGKHHFGQAFHLCADDHCQCYRGTRYERPTSERAVNECLGETLFYQEQVCDARYAKICGGVMERYENVWDNRSIPYLTSGVDGEIQIDFPLNTEEKARAFIDSSPDVFCNTDQYQLPEMLAYSNNLFRWQVTYTQEELTQIIHQKMGDELGELLEIEPLERGDSGRLIYMNLVGTKKTIKVGKELEIRRVLSKSHLYSSCFYVTKQLTAENGVHFILTGAGWGHGVGLCQVGATIMAQKGYSYQNILKHYFKNSRLIKLY